jgi:hypothetical protein
MSRGEGPDAAYRLLAEYLSRGIEISTGKRPRCRKTENGKRRNVAERKNGEHVVQQISHGMTCAIFPRATSPPNDAPRGLSKSVRLMHD